MQRGNNQVYYMHSLGNYVYAKFSSQVRQILFLSVLNSCYTQTLHNQLVTRTTAIFTMFTHERNLTRIGSNCKALQLEGRTTSRQSFWAYVYQL